VLAVEVRGLYQAETIVTGRGESERLRGFRIGLEEVVAKLSGDAERVRSQGVKRLLTRAADFVERYEYEDRMQGIPIHDEQGTRERPHYLRMTFRRSAVDETLRVLGMTPWGGDRPKVMVWLGIRDSVRSYVLGSETAFGYGQREVLKSVSKERGVPIMLPVMDAKDRAVIAYDSIAEGDLSRLRLASERYDADATLFGTLVMNETGYWILAWSLDWKSHLRRSQLEGVTFDVALRAAIERAAKIFSTSSEGG
jgi:hypothetical protein